MVGEKVEYINMDSQAVYQAMADGDIDLVHEIWEGAFGASYDKAKASGGVLRNSYSRCSNKRRLVVSKSC